MSQASDATQRCKAAYSGRTVPELHRSSLFTQNRNCEIGSPQTGCQSNPAQKSVNSGFEACGGDQHPSTTRKLVNWTVISLACAVARRAKFERHPAKCRQSSNVNGLTRVLSGNSTGWFSRWDSKTEAIISMMSRASSAPHRVGRCCSMLVIKSLMAAIWPPS